MFRDTVRLTVSCKSRVRKLISGRPRHTRSGVSESVMMKSGTTLIKEAHHSCGHYPLGFTTKAFLSHVSFLVLACYFWPRFCIARIPLAVLTQLKHQQGHQAHSKTLIWNKQSLISNHKLTIVEYRASAHLNVGDNLIKLGYVHFAY